MTQFIAALLVFLALHMVPAIPPLRAGLIVAVGRRNYLIAYSLVSLLALGWLFQAALALDFTPLWDAAPWHAAVTILLTPIGLVFLVAGLLSSNPASITLRKPDMKSGAITAITRHPVLWGFALWAGSHLVPNGDLRSVLLFGALFAFAIVGMFITDRRTRRRLGPLWVPIAHRTSILPFAALMTGRARPAIDAPLLIGIGVSAIITAWLLMGVHAAIFGADPLATMAM